MAATSSVSDAPKTKSTSTSSTKAKADKSTGDASFENKLASAKQKQGTLIAKPVVVNLGKKFATVKPVPAKSVLTDAKNSPATEADENSTAQDFEADANPTSTIPTNTPPLASKPKSSDAKATDVVEADKAIDAKNTDQPLAAIDDSESQHSDESNEGKPKPRATTATSKTQLLDPTAQSATAVQPIVKIPPKSSDSGATPQSKSAGAVVKAVSPDHQSKAIDGPNVNGAQDASDQASGDDTDDADSSPLSSPTFGGDVGAGKLAASRDGTSGDLSASGDSSTAASANSVPPDPAGAIVQATIDAPALSALAVSSAKPHSIEAAALTSNSALNTSAVKDSSTAATVKQAPPTAAATQARFVEDNHPKIVSAITGQLLPNGGKLQIRLDPPDMGSLQITVQMRNGIMTAAFETSNDEATRVLSHSLGQLKSTLEAAGMSVEKLHVEQAPKRSGESSSDNDSQSSSQDQNQQAQQEKQRRELMQRVWRRMSGDPLDMVA